MKHFRSVVSLLLVFVLCFGMVPYASAEEAPTQTTTEAPQPTEDTTAKESPPATEAPETTETVEAPEAATEATEPATEAPTEETENPSDDVPFESEDDRILDADTYASTQNSIMLFDYADNGDYTTRLNYQVSCTYQPNTPLIRNGA